MGVSRNVARWAWGGVGHYADCFPLETAQRAAGAQPAALAAVERVFDTSAPASVDVDGVPTGLGIGGGDALRRP
jgi:hypothetical protein